ncbi:unnamed protein product [Oncorhynchus mykiss]|uniref:Uncharacterized protein n=1 Tax=Oncorhynchus mykiss TaxID=8022 RepID=A0A060WS73_ONCMY|nr:unnamed protein product [Oncorhynchus mykiss]
MLSPKRPCHSNQCLSPLSLFTLNIFLLASSSFIHPPFLYNCSSAFQFFSRNNFFIPPLITSLLTFLSSPILSYCPPSILLISATSPLDFLKVLSLYLTSMQLYSITSECNCRLNFPHRLITYIYTQYTYNKFIILSPPAPPEFMQWPQSVSKPAGGSAVFTCVAQGVPEPHLIWLKNGKILMPSDNVKLTNNNSTLAMTRITSEDEAIYQCIAENMAGTNQASARLAVSLAKDLPDSPQGLTATALSPRALQLAWIQPPAEITDGIIGYVLHSRKIGEPDSRELQEAVSKTTFQHNFINLEPATTYSIYLKAYSPLGASQQSSTVVATTLGGVPTPPTFFTKVVNSTAVQVLWELPSKPGKAEGFRLTYRRVPHTNFQGPVQFPCHVNAHTISRLETGAVYEVNLVAYNGNGESGCSKRLVSLTEEGINAKTSGECGENQCNCIQDGEGSMGGIVVGIHISMACIIFCVLFLMFGYRRR